MLWCFSLPLYVHCTWPHFHGSMTACKKYCYLINEMLSYTVYFIYVIGYILLYMSILKDLLVYQVGLTWPWPSGGPCTWGAVGGYGCPADRGRALRGGLYPPQVYRAAAHVWAVQGNGARPLRHPQPVTWPPRQDRKGVISMSSYMSLENRPKL